MSILFEIIIYWCRILDNEYNYVCRQIFNTNCSSFSVSRIYYITHLTLNRFNVIINCWYQLQKCFLSAVCVDILHYISNFDSYQLLSRKNDLNRFKYSSRTSEIYNTPRENKFHRSSIEIKLEIQKILLNNRGKYNLNHKKLIYFW